MSTNLAQNLIPIQKQMPVSARWLLKLLERTQHGSLLIMDTHGQSWHFGQSSAIGAVIRINNWECLSKIAKGGDIGFAEGYLAGEWSSPDLVVLLEFALKNRQQLESVFYGSFLGSLLYKLKHFLNRNTKAQAKKNIHAHYDLGNAFYQLWLDPSMTYSSALYTSDTQPLAHAQANKYAKLLEWVAPTHQQNILEVGFGWGGFAQAALQAGHTLTGLTLSTEQLDYTQQRLAAYPTEQLNLRLQDYRDCTGQFDAIVSIEMFEAVGQTYWNTYFNKLHGLLKTGGRAAIQTITIDESLFEKYSTSTDFIQQYIFPGGMLPTPSTFKALAEQAGFTVKEELAFGLDYAKTLRAWRKTFLQKLEEVKQQGFDQTFIRTWEFYLAYCEAGFTQGSTNVYHFYLEKK